MKILIIMFIIMVLFSNYYKTKRSLHMLQQNLYNENNRYLKWLIKNKSQFVDFDLLTIPISFLCIFIFQKTEVLYFSISFIIVLLLITGIEWKKNIKNDQNKKKLVITSRIKRLITTTLVLYLVPIVLLFVFENKIWIFILIICLMTYLNQIVIYIAKLINTPIEKSVYLYYKSKAVKKLESMNNLKVIGITGSYGKTSSKNILSDILNIKYNVLPTPKNLNTYNGLIMTVNNYMDKFTDIFVAEMGAYVKGEIKGLCKLVKPKYGILTTIGTAHLESFGSEQNIIDGKFELIESLPSDGFAVLNGDDEKQVNYKLKNKVKIIWIGINNQDADVVAKNIKCSGKGTSFDVVFKGDKNKYSFETKLLGKHNVYNILAALACGKEFGIEINSLIRAVKNVKPVEHRLELKKLGNFYQIDDAYNSNPVGAKNACEILGMMDGIKVVVTPGMIELGLKEDEYNEIFGEQIAEVADYVILIGKNKTKAIQKGLNNKKFDKEKIILFNDVRDAYPYLNTMGIDKEVYALFENDLPDTFNEK